MQTEKEKILKEHLGALRKELKNEVFKNLGLKEELYILGKTKINLIERIERLEKNNDILTKQAKKTYKIKICQWLDRFIKKIK